MRLHFTKQLKIGAIMALCTLFSSLKSQAQFTIIGNSFATNANPNCSFSDTCFTLTSATAWQNGAVWHAQQFDLSQPFDGVFCLYLGNANTNINCGDDTEDNGADGFAFVLKGLNAANIGNAGGDLGYVGISPSIAIEFDTYPNPGNFADLSGDHTAMVINGNITNPVQGPILLEPSGLNVEDGNYHTARLVWNPTAFLLSMYFDNVLRFTHTQDLVNTVFNGNPFVNWGFTASTGGCYNQQQICFPSIYLDLVNQIELCKGDSTLIQYNNDNITDYFWQDQNGDTITYWDNTLGIPLTDTSFYASQSGYYTLTLTQNNINMSDSILVTVANPVINLGNDTSFCEGNHVLLDASLSGYSYLWSDNSTNSVLNITQSGTYWVQVISPLGNCIAQDTIIIDVVNNPTVDFGNDTSFCQGGNITLDATNINVNYIWSDNSTDSVLNITQSGTYWVQVNNSALTTCNDADTINISVEDIPTVNLGNDTSFCIGGNITLDASNPNATYLWSNNSTNSTLNINQTGTYWVQVSNQNLATCFDQDTIVLDIIDLPVADLGNDRTVCEESILIFSGVANTSTSILWNDGSDQSYLLVDTTGVYGVTLSNSCGTSSDLVYIEFIDPDFCNCLIFIPNAFTPNNDLINEEFLPIVNCIIDEYEILVFNRWGEKVFQSSTVGEAWDGTFKGKQCPNGVYPYFMTYRNPGLPYMKKKGHVNLHR